MTTLTGFKDHLRTPEQWRGYIAELDARIAAHEAEIRNLQADGRRQEARMLLCRDLIYDHRFRALYELRRLIGAQDANPWGATRAH